MAQVTTQELTQDVGRIASTEVPVTGSLAEILDIPIPRVKPCAVAIEVKNTHVSVALTDFAIQVRINNGNWTTIISGTDWATDGIQRVMNGVVPNTLAAGATSIIFIEFLVPVQVRLAASGNGATLNIYAAASSLR